MDSGSSSGESDDEMDVPTGRPAGVAVSAPKPAPVAASPAAAPSSAADQMKARLKNLYQTQNKRPAQTSASQPPPLTKISSRLGVPMNPRPGMAHPASVPPSSRPQSRVPSQPPTQTMPTSQPRMRQQQPLPQQPMQPVRSPLPAKPGQYSRSNHSGHTTHHTHSTHPSQSSRTHSTSQPRSSSHADVHDPFAPTPLSKIQAREQQKLGHKPSTSSRPSSSMPGSYSGSQSGGGTSQMYSSGSGSGSGSRADPTMAAREQEVRRQKERFLIFTRVLIKYLEQKDLNMHRQAKAIIKDCADRNKKKEPGYQSVTASMKTRLKELVGESYWRRAEAYLKHYLDQQKKKAGTQGSSSSSSAQAIKQQQLERQKLQQQQQQRQRAAQIQAQRRTAQAQHHQQQQQQQQPPNLTMLQQEVSNRRSEISRVGGVRTPTSANVAAAKGTDTHQKKPTVLKGKGRAVTPTSRKPGTPVMGAPTGKSEEPPQEYLELMQMVDHAVTFDFKAAGQLIKSNKFHIQVNKEQKQLLYSEIKLKFSTLKKKAGPLPGWDRTNVFSARAAWARVRLPERKTSPKAPVVGGGLLTLPSVTPAGTNDGSTAWTNAEKAEQDIVLAMLSESCQEYLKGILQKAVHCARQRQNVDGVRLWHQQHTAAIQGNAATLSLRLGCDISRQVAQAAGNAAMTCKRMEEVLERQSDVPASARILKDEALEKATSMGELSLRPQLAKGVEGADLQARRSFEIYEGKHSSEPPLGRIPKKAKVEKIDLMHGSTLDDNIGRHRAVTSSGSTYY